jgi:hypothetical protein
MGIGEKEPHPFGDGRSGVKRDVLGLLPWGLLGIGMLGHGLVAHDSGWAQAGALMLIATAILSAGTGGEKR